MPFFIKTEIIKKEYLINHDLKQKIIKNDPMIKNNLVEWKLNEWVDSNK